MSSAYEPPEYKYIAYIDESGDPGLKTVKPIDPSGSSEWLVVSAVVIGAEREPELAGWISDLREKLNSPQLRDIHFQKLHPARKLIACNHLADLPIRCFVVASNKRNMRRYVNPFAEKIPSDNWYYCWLTRLLLERVTHWVENKSKAKYGSAKRVKLVYSERGGLRYSQMNAYYEWLRHKGDKPFLALGNLAWSTMDMRLLEVRNHAAHDGLKLPDIVASAFFKGIDIHDTHACDPQFAKALEPRMARWPEPNGRISGYGVKLMPSWKVLKVDEVQREVFRHYGYPAQWWADGGS